MKRFPCLSLVLLCWLCAGARAAEKTTKIVLIGKDRDHPQGAHMYMYDCEIMARCLRQTPGIETVVTNGWPKDPDVFKDVKAIVLDTRMGGNVLFGGPQRRQAEDLLKQGVGLTAIHWSTGADVGEIGEHYLHTLGGWFNTDFSRYLVQKSTVRQADPAHPICRGWKDYDLREEYYIQLRFMPESKPIMKAVVDGKEYVIGWTYERPNSKEGRSFGFVGGHFHDNFAEKPFRQAVINGILWTAHLEVPEGGAPCAITEKDMELPPELKPKK